MLLGVVVRPAHASFKRSEFALCVRMLSCGETTQGMLRLAEARHTSATLLAYMLAQTCTLLLQSSELTEHDLLVSEASGTTAAHPSGVAHSACTMHIKQAYRADVHALPTPVPYSASKIVLLSFAQISYCQHLSWCT